jgi:hypothetical protein
MAKIELPIVWVSFVTVWTHCLVIWYLCNERAQFVSIHGTVARIRIEVRTMMFEATPPRMSASEAPSRSPAAEDASANRRMSPPPTSGVFSPSKMTPSTVDHASPGDDGSPYETNSIKFADYFQPQQQPQQESLMTTTTAGGGSAFHQDQSSSLVRQTSSVVFDSAGLAAPNSHRPPPPLRMTTDVAAGDASIFSASRPASANRPAGSGDTRYRSAVSGNSMPDDFNMTPRPLAAVGSSASFSNAAVSPLQRMGSTAAGGQQQLQREALRQIATELKERQAQLVQRELACQRREESLTKREKQLEESLARLHQDRLASAEAAAEKAKEVDPRQGALERSLQSAEEYRQQLRSVHKELSARELEVDALAQELASEREKVAAQKLELETRAAVLMAEEDDMHVDVKRHADRIQASSRLMSDRLREIDRKEKDLERTQFEWDLKDADYRRRLHDVQAKEAALESKTKEVQRVLDGARALELHAVQTQRIGERLRIREENLWATAAKVVPHGARAIAAIKEDMRQHHQKLEDIGAQLPAVLKASVV